MRFVFFGGRLWPGVINRISHVLPWELGPWGLHLYSLGTGIASASIVAFKDASRDDKGDERLRREVLEQNDDS